jgi:hypothetical protein
VTTKIYNMRDAWIDSTVPYTSIKMNTFDISSDINSKLMDLKKNGLSQFTIDKFGEIITGTLDIPRVNNLEESITALSSAGLAKVDYIAANLAILQANTTSSNNDIGLVYSDPVIVNNDWYYFDSNTSTWSNTGLLPALAEQLTPRKAVERTFYVTMNGNDNDANTYINQTSNTGMSIYKPFQTIGAALQAAADTQQSCVIIVHPGEYEVAPDTEIPVNCCLYGYDARVTKVRIAEGFEENNMFLLNSGCKVRGLTFTGLRHEASWLAAHEGSLDYGPPTKGYAFAFKPGAFITRSPYIADCTTIHDLTYQQMSLPQDREKGNPHVPMTGGCLYADGSVVDPDSPLRSVVVDSFTAVNPNGVGYAITKNALVQLVSIFTNWSRVGIWTNRGGQVTVVNSNATFGDFAFASTGFRYVVRLEPIDELLFVEGNKSPVFGDFIRSNVDTIVDYLMNDPAGYQTIPDFSTTILANNELANLTSRDTKTILLETADDLKTAQDTGTRFWIQSLFDAAANTESDVIADSVFAFDEAFVPLFSDTYEVMRDYLMSRTVDVAGTEPTANALVNAMFSFAVTVINNPEDFTQTFKSTIEAASHQFSYAGSGVNFNALPFGQRATGVATDPTRNLYTSNGGVIYATFSTEAGDTYLGQDLKVDFERSTIEGQAFSRGVQNIALPLIIGIGG